VEIVTAAKTLFEWLDSHSPIKSVDTVSRLGEDVPINYCNQAISLIDLSMSVTAIVRQLTGRGLVSNVHESTESGNTA
jgi:hypothetical protein